MNRLQILFFFFGSILFTQCIPPTEEVITDINIDFKNKKLQRLYMFQDRLQTDSLFQFLRDADPTLRYMSALSFASIQDPKALDSLEVLLKDRSEDVKTAAAYAIGQIGLSSSEDKLLAAFDQLDSAGIHQYSNAAILEAIGKSASKKYLDPLSSVSTYKVTDTLLLEGQTRAIYQYGLRDITTPSGTERMVALATTPGYPASIRTIAANYLYRVKNLKLSEYEEIIAEAIGKEDDPHIRMTLAITLGKTKSEKALTTLTTLLEVERDARVRANILRAFKNFDYANVEAIVLKSLKDPNLQVATTAAEFFIDNGIPESATLYWRTAKDPTLHWQTQVYLYKAANRHIPNYFAENIKFINWELKRKFETSINPYEKAEIVRALGEFGWNYVWLKRLAFPADEAVVRTAAMESFGKYIRYEDFNKVYGLSGKRIRRDLISYFVEAIDIGDPGMMAVAAEVMRDPKVGFKASLDSLTFMETALQKLDLPREIETYNEVKKTLDYFKTGKVGESIQPDFNHPIDWITFNSISKDAVATIKTNKGSITIDLMTDLAPGTVVNFIRLIKNGFYKNKAFHRVVPNFVIQTGCPRGDGYGSLDYTIRSELPYLHYEDAGYVGMASAGKHTEGTQFFITHSPTMHLNGRYTIFAKVIEGLDVVQNISVGDFIEEIIIE